MSRGRAHLALVVLCAVAAGLAVLAGKGLNESLVYYRTPSEVVVGPAGANASVRIGGLVVPGSVHRAGPVTRLRLTDGATDIEVVHRGGLPELFGEGRGVVVEGRLDSGGVLNAERILARHANEYRPVEDRA